MELNKKTINTVVNALQIAKKVTELSILIDISRNRIVSDFVFSRIDNIINNELRTSEKMKEYDDLIAQFKGLAERQDYELLGE